MSDIIREVDEELRREKLAAIWKNYGGYIAAGAFLIVAATGGWRGYEYYAEKQAEAASLRFEAAQKLAADATKNDEAKAAFEALIKDSPASYKLLSRFANASEIGKKNPKEGAAAFDAIANDSSVDAPLRDLARVRGAMLVVDTRRSRRNDEASRARARARLRRSATRRRNCWRLAYVRANDQASAQKLFLELSFDPETPPGLRNRAQRLQSFLFGNVPSAPATQ